MSTGTLRRHREAKEKLREGDASEEMNDANYAPEAAEGLAQSSEVEAHRETVTPEDSSDQSEAAHKSKKAKAQDDKVYDDPAYTDESETAHAPDEAKELVEDTHKDEAYVEESEAVHKAKAKGKGK